MADNIWHNGQEVVVGCAFNAYKLGDAVVLILSHPRYGPLSFHFGPEAVGQIATSLQSTLAESGSGSASPSDLPKAH